MSTQNQLSDFSLWQKISQFRLDDSPEAVVNFSDKLAKEQKWSSIFTARAIAEYKKFLYLCMTLPQGASPSDTIDKVWHLHLTYTESYWKKLCGEVLQRQLHHHPSKGGASENQRHQDWYAETLIGYVKEFEELPPTDFWSLPEGLNLEQFLPTKSAFRKPTLTLDNSLQINSTWAAGAMLLLITSLIGLSLNGLWFLPLYGLLIGWAFWGVALRSSLKQRILEAATQQLHPYHFAATFKNTETTFRTIIADFTEKGLLTYFDSGHFGFEKNTAKPLLYNLQAQDSDSLTPVALREVLYPFAKKIHELTATLKSDLKLKTTIFSVFSWWVLGIGIVRLIMGIGNGKSIGFLALMLLLYGLIWMIVSNLNKIDLESYKQQYQANEWGGQIAVGALAFMLLDSQYSLGGNQDLNKVFNPHYTQANDSSGWLGGAYTSNNKSSSGDSGGGCSSGGDGGGGDGGGGGCGGGCGGCGGS